MSARRRRGDALGDSGERLTGAGSRLSDPGGRLSDPGDRLSQSRSPRRVLDLIVQTSGVELFEAYGVAAAPTTPAVLDPSQIDEDCLGARVNFTATDFQGLLVLCVPRSILHRTADAGAGVQGDHDWLRELCNQLMGRIRNRLARYQVALNPGVPSTVEGAALRRLAETHTDLAYSFRTLGGSVVVWLSGDFDRASMVFSSAVDVVGEGDVVLF